MSVESYTKFRRSVEKRGIWFASHVWKEPRTVDGKKGFRWCIVDGTGRRRMFAKMREDGDDIPPIPCVEIEAANLKEAKEAVLAASSVYHKMTPDGLYEFMDHAEIDMAGLETFDLPINMEKFEESFFTDPAVSDEDGSTELDRGTFTKFSQQCPKCGFSFDDKVAKDAT